MSLGGGLLVGAVTVDLSAEALDGIGPTWTILVLLSSAAVFSGANYIVSNRGARHRKRCGECVSQPDEEDEPGSGKAIAIGTAMDALPEALVLGVTLAAGGSGYAVAAALGLGNVSQALSSTSGLHDADRSKRFIFMLWGGVAAAVVVVTVGSVLLLGSGGEAVVPWVEASAAGVLLAMVTEAMLPEAFHKSPSFSGLLAAVGFCGFIVLAASLG
ncbi:MAG: ZIP family zinc transporter [Rubricoccaceae bacterium]